jgi:hypothetical protein
LSLTFTNTRYLGHNLPFAIPSPRTMSATACMAL